jgi:hypothetical protein
MAAMTFIGLPQHLQTPGSVFLILAMSFARGRSLLGRVHRLRRRMNSESESESSGAF